MEFLQITQPLSQFLFMGCWNKDGCTASQGQKAVAAAIRREPANWPLFLGGDNIYPDKHEKRKTYPPKRVEEGVACLIRKAPRQIFATVGNHNIASADVLEAEVALDLWTLKSHSYCVQFANNQSVIFLNSNPFDEMEHTRPLTDMLEALDAALAHLKKTRTPYIMVMHHPIVALKKKSYYLMPQHALLLDSLRAYPPQLLLVADTHNYQLGTVTWKGTDIRQVVVGTGGADLDPLPEAGVHAADFAGTYVVEDAKVAYGYLRVSMDAAITIEFVEPHMSAPDLRVATYLRTSRSPRRTGYCECEAIARLAEPPDNAKWRHCRHSHVWSARSRSSSISSRKSSKSPKTSKSTRKRR